MGEATKDAMHARGMTAMPLTPGWNAVEHQRLPIDADGKFELDLQALREATRRVPGRAWSPAVEWATLHGRGHEARNARAGFDCNAAHAGLYRLPPIHI